MFISKFVKLTGAIALSGAILIPTVPAKAAWSDWQSVPSAGSNCKVKVYTDATNYLANTKTVNAKAETNGKCGNLFYDMQLSYRGSRDVSRDAVSGVFKSSTSIKQLEIRDVEQDEKTHVAMYLFTDPSRTTPPGVVYSDSIYLSKNK